MTTITSETLEAPACEGSCACDHASEAAASGGVNAQLAVALWVVVGSLLCYGVVQTALKAAALFG